ncbi:YfiT family bacillithiol transferase [Paenibacillus harenae]|uniref:Damage-inducible protein DinB n=1 Tax=Paenibacillus harenae TaxID=306543 RepID=A0ABT9U033_PAEHA|nr:putative metal-dependent hydrolase [Paenibacillus harenae]MDQ0059573.1 putative damage-inducible protein DinB [Paenibacillus harenae]MDQ0112986.1 putative damage-inducible protein DinB [Paenibacillus harenae]
MEKLRYPIGRYVYEGMTTKQMEQWIADMERLPGQLRESLSGLSEEQLDTAYRSGGWTARQVAHHLADAAMNCFSRFKLALTETNPTIKPFDEELWAETADSLNASPDISLAIVEGIYARWVLLLRSMERADYDKQFYHPEQGKQIGLAYFLGFAAWHGKHHVAHINIVKERTNGH